MSSHFTVRGLAGRRILGLLAALLMLSSGLRAAVVTQTATFSDTQNASGTGTLVHGGPSGFSSNVFRPFNSSLGTLISFTIDWSASIVASGTVNSGVAGGFVTSELNGNLELLASSLTESYNSMGGNAGDSKGPGVALGPITATATNSKTYLVSNAGVTYNPAVRDAVMGLGSYTPSSAFTLQFANGTTNTAKVEYSNVAGVTSTFTGNVTLTYTYTPAPSVAEPGATAPLLAGAIALLGWRFRRRR